MLPVVILGITFGLTLAMTTTPVPPNGMHQSTHTYPCMPPDIDNGRHSITSLGGILRRIWDFGVPHGQSVRISVSCDPGFDPQPTVDTQCQNGTWTEPWPSCERERRACPVSRSIFHGTRLQFVNGDESVELRDFPDSHVPDGTTLVSRCVEPGKYRLIGSVTRRCTYGSWYPEEEPRCESVPTKVLILGTSTKHTHYKSNGTVVIYSGQGHLYIDCYIDEDETALADIQASHVRYPNTYFLRGYRKRLHRLRLVAPRPKHSGIFTCTDSRTTSSHSVRIQIEEISCDNPGIPDHGHRVYGDVPRGVDVEFPIGMEVRYSCDPDYRLHGSKEITCLLGQWSHPTPRCERTVCPDVPVPEHAEMFGQQRNIGARKLFFCEEGYRLVGESNFMDCEAGGVWSYDPPTCEEIVETVSPCEWTHCESWQKCVITGFNQTECLCISPSNCQSTGPQVCGTDGVNYTSICQLKAFACVLRTGVEVATDPNVCIDPPENNGSQQDYAEVEWSGSVSSSQSFESSYPRGNPPEDNQSEPPYLEGDSSLSAPSSESRFLNSSEGNRPENNQSESPYSKDESSSSTSSSEGELTTPTTSFEGELTTPTSSSGEESSVSVSYSEDELTAPTTSSEGELTTPTTSPGEESSMSISYSEEEPTTPTTSSEKEFSSSSSSSESPDSSYPEGNPPANNGSEPLVHSERELSTSAPLNSTLV